MDARDIDADGNTSNQPADGTSVTSWKDRSAYGHTFNATVPSGSWGAAVVTAPIYRASVAKFGGKPGLDFRSKAWLIGYGGNNIAWFDSSAHSTVRTLSGVTSIDSYDSFYTNAGSFFTNGESHSASRDCYAMRILSFTGNNDTSSNWATPFPIGSSPHDFTRPVTRVGVYNGSGNLSFSVSSKANGVASVAVPSPTSLNANHTSIGAWPYTRCSDSGTDVLDDVGEILVYRKALSATEQCQLKHYYDAKWGGQSATLDTSCSSVSACGTSPGCAARTCKVHDTYVENGSTYYFMEIGVTNRQGAKFVVSRRDCAASGYTEDTTKEAIGHRWICRYGSLNLELGPNYGNYSAWPAPTTGPLVYVYKKSGASCVAETCAGGPGIVLLENNENNGHLPPTFAACTVTALPEESPWTNCW
jgi:hypothetical protein